MNWEVIKPSEPGLNEWGSSVYDNHKVVRNGKQVKKRDSNSHGTLRQWYCKTSLWNQCLVYATPVYTKEWHMNSYSCVYWGFYCTTVTNFHVVPSPHISEMCKHTLSTKGKGTTLEFQGTGCANLSVVTISLKVVEKKSSRARGKKHGKPYLNL